MLKRLLLCAVLATAIVVPTAGSAHPAGPGDCITGTHQTFAKLLQPQGGSIQVQTTPTGPIVLQSGGPVQGIFISTTGTIEVEIDHACLTSLSLTVTKNGSPPTAVYSNTWGSECEHSTRTQSVPIGLDGGDYTFQLGGSACNDKPLRGDGNGGFVGDPPIL